jgi:hypothetical protein
VLERLRVAKERCASRVWVRVRTSDISGEEEVLFPSQVRGLHWLGTRCVRGRGRDTGEGARQHIVTAAFSLDSCQVPGAVELELYVNSTCFNLQINFTYHICVNTVTGSLGDQMAGISEWPTGC